MSEQKEASTSNYISGQLGDQGSGKASVFPVRSLIQLHGHSLMMLQEDSYIRVKMIFRLKNGLKSTMIIPMPLDTDLF